ncbi:MAG TPA: CDP-alcohol phosphatidyltransferase family protein [Candidatus Acidoferrales bacterium]|jgi:phosphatidylglycerophosphate synthase|nr:CDP-alcohol phosphatidyltransferase family protein [Candidatus Acidoferrales bacterium]
MRNEQEQIKVKPCEDKAGPERQTATSVSFKDAFRLQESFTAPLKSKVLPWLAAKMPAQINSDHLTFLGFLSMFLAGASYTFARTHRYGLILATVFLALNWFGDSLDGTLARLRNRQRPRYGFYVDHMIDTFGGLFLMGGLALSGFIDWRIALGMFIAFLMLSVQVYLATYTVGTFQLSFAKFGPTEIRILLATGNAALWFYPDMRVFGASLRLFDVGGIIAIAGMSGMLVVSTIYNTAKLYRAETLS